MFSMVNCDVNTVTLGSQMDKREKSSKNRGKERRKEGGKERKKRKTKKGEITICVFWEFGRIALVWYDFL
jgi:hypothetical protein